jgi:5-hydroxyisourate hydrolase-like protein (transthyretin family)
MMVDNQSEREDRELAEELAARLDAGLLTPTEDDSPELKALLATYSELQDAVPEPDPSLYKQVKQSILQGERERGSEETPDGGQRQRRPSFWSAQRWLAPAFYGLTVLLVVFGFAALWWVDTLPTRVDDQQTILLGQTQLMPDSDASVRVVVQDYSRGVPIEGALVRVSLKPSSGRAIPLFEGQTDGTGSLPIEFRVPSDASGEARLVVETESAAGKDTVEQPVTILREYRLLLSSDKPLYQPGQTIHMRALALSTFDQTPARSARVDFLVEDAKGNKVFRESVTASEYGIAAADFVLADLVNQGDYKLNASIEEAEGDESRSEKTVEVRPYVLPKFGVEVLTDRSYYLPGQSVAGVVQADYFFGKPVAGGQVQISGSVWDVERTEVVDLVGQTDEKGSYAFRFDLPDYFAGSGLESGQAEFALEVTVVDQTDHAEQTSRVLPIAEQPLIIEAVPESGVLKPGVENIVYILTSYPDGRPAQARLEVRVNGQEEVEVASGEYGLAEVAFTPRAGNYHFFEIVASDETGLAARRQVEFETEGRSDSVLLRADRAAYVVGETMHLVALSPVEFGSLYLDIVKAGQTLSTRSGLIEGGKAEFAVDLSPDLYGTLELHAYKVLLDGTIVRDTRLVVVDEANEVGIAITADQDSYLPGEMATLGFQTTDAQDPGAGVQSALGVAIVDESVFALQRQDPGFAKLYFMLEQELMEPFYQVKGFEMPAAVPVDEEPMRDAQDQAVKATWADVPVLAVSNLSNSRVEKLDAVRAGQREGFDRIGTLSALGLTLIPPLMFGGVVIAFWQAGVLKRALLRLLAALGILTVTGGVLACGLVAVAISFYFLEVEWVILLLGGVLGLAMLVFTGYAWVRGDPLARFLAQLSLAWVGLVAVLVLSIQRGSEPSEWLAITAFLAYLLVPGAYLLFGQGRWIQARRLFGKLGTGMGALSAVPTLVLLALMVLLIAGCSGALEQPLGVLSDEVGDVGGFASRQAGADWKEAGEPETLNEVGLEAVAAEPPRLRQYFPETLYWAPEVLTDEGGHVSVEIPMADSITTWRLTALASTQDGRLGSTTRGVRVFQDFFVDVDLPVSLTQDDEISIPIGVFNYLPDAQQVRLEVDGEDWFELTGPGERTLTIASNDIVVVYFPIRVLRFGRQGFQVTAWGEKMSDAIRRTVNVVPNGKAIHHTESDWLRESKRVPVTVPGTAVPGATAVEVKIYPGAMAQAVEGLEKILRLPHG